jgi:enoyl-CoA hydratase/carnithine racemase
MLGGARLAAAEAQAAGLADVVVPVTELRGALGTDLLRLGLAEPTALRATKRIVGRTLEDPLPVALDAAAREFAGLLRHGAAREGIVASRERRAPSWQPPPPRLPEFP